MAVTLLDMREASKDRADMQDDHDVLDPTWNRWINDGIERLYRIVARVGSGSFQANQAFTLTAASNLFALPATCRRVLGVSKDPTVPGQRKSLPKYNQGERDSFGLLNALAYRVIANNVAIEPFQLCAGNYALYYVTGPTKLVADSDTVDSVLEPYDDYATTWAAICALGKEESDNRDLYQELAALEQDVREMFMIRDGEDPEVITDDDSRGPSYWTIP